MPRTAPNGSPCDYECAPPNEARDGDIPSQTPSSIRVLSKEDKARLKERYGMEYSRYDAHLSPRVLASVSLRIPGKYSSLMFIGVCNEHNTQVACVLEKMRVHASSCTVLDLARIC